MTTHNKNLIDLLGRAAADIRMENASPKLVETVKQRVLDNIGCLVAGYHAGVSDALRNYITANGGRAECTFLPYGDKTTVSLASFAHAAYIHGLELSDIAPRGTAHPGNEIVPTALSIAERDNLDGQALMAGIVAGYEIEIRFGRAVFPSAFYEGWWTPGLLGPIGVAMTAGRMMGFDAAKQANNLGIVLNLLPTATARANEEGASVKWIIGGHATATGLLAADMAAAGVGGMREIVEGWLPIISTTNWPERLSEGIRADGSFEQYEILSGIITKHYSTVGPLTSALDATFDMILDHGIKADDVVEIEAECMKRTAVFNTVHPANEVTARASLPYCLAVALLTGDRGQLVGPAFRQEMLNNKAVHDIAERVRIVENEEYERQYPAKSLARVTLKLKDGTSHSKEVDRSTRGRYLTPTDKDIESKFRLITEPILGAAAASRIVDKVWNLETMKSVSGLVDDLILPRR